MPIEFRDSDPEILFITYAGAFTDHDFERALERMASVLARARAERRKVAFVSIGTTDSNMSARQRQRSSDWLKENTTLLREACIGQSVVVPGTIQRGVLTAILWMIDYPVPMRACPSEAEAVSYVRSLREASASRQAFSGVSR